MMMIFDYVVEGHVADALHPTYHLNSINLLNQKHNEDYDDDNHDSMTMMLITR